MSFLTHRAGSPLITVAISVVSQIQFSHTHLFTLFLTPLPPTCPPLQPLVQERPQVLRLPPISRGPGAGVPHGCPEAREPYLNSRYPVSQPQSPWSPPAQPETAAKCRSPSETPPQGFCQMGSDEQEIMFHHTHTHAI